MSNSNLTRRAQRAGVAPEEYNAREDSGLRHCTKCLRWKDRDEFPPAKMQRDGINARCRDCAYPRRSERPAAMRLAEPPVADCGWMAGFVDGEGSIMLTRYPRKDRPTPAYSVVILVTNTKVAALKVFQTYYGGDIYDAHPGRTPEQKDMWSTAFRWMCPHSRVSLFLEDMMSHLRIKRRQAEIACEFLHTRDGFQRQSWPGQGGGSTGLSDAEIACRDRLYQEMTRLNKRGKVGERERDAWTGDGG